MKNLRTILQPHPWRCIIFQPSVLVPACLCWPLFAYIPVMSFVYTVRMIKWLDAPKQQTGSHVIPDIELVTAT
ncbi:hypothetical protein EDC04DRAFT_2634340 [Pisolithus marmoratus]|nr:hypothetical protein EDC04DRAFT_2634340 [Pisolithus marmoratus]